MTLSELIKTYGDEKVEFQHLDGCFIDAQYSGGTTKIKFGTPGQRIGPNGTTELGIIVWLDRERVSEILDEAKAKGGE